MNEKSMSLSKMFIIIVTVMILFVISKMFASESDIKYNGDYCREVQNNIVLYKNKALLSNNVELSRRYTDIHNNLVKIFHTCIEEENNTSTLNTQNKSFKIYK